jgi:hypothetical protein
MQGVSVNKSTAPVKDNEIASCTCNTADFGLIRVTLGNQENADLGLYSVPQVEGKY